MSWGHRLVSRWGFGTGAAATTAVIVGGFAIGHGYLSIATLTGSSKGGNVAAVEPPLSMPLVTAEAGPAGNDTTATVGNTTAQSPASGTAVVAGTGATSVTDLSESSSPRSAPASPSGSDPATTTSSTLASSSGSAPATSSTTETADLAEQVLDQINQARTSAGLSALLMSPGLVKSAAEHNTVMAAGCGLSHQCAGESDLGKRITAQGVPWTAAGENVGQGGPEPDDGDAIVAMAMQLAMDMLAETAPNDGHKKNILSKSFKHVGISLYRDAGGTVWMTQDFAS